MILHELKDYLEKHGTVSRKELARHFHLSEDGIDAMLSVWMKKGVISRLVDTRKGLSANKGLSTSKELSTSKKLSTSKGLSTGQESSADSGEGKPRQVRYRINRERALSLTVIM
ncbi:FeoC like transcriptional regulator [Vibrio aerogenes CECT 7868]|uniref:FeoC like transcriptional regulator n=1 Tax=Vibrio aerogenes CECT 7868 TaxID=1216006 RepID=A0A1M6CTE2_9VIBR|nr:FeoC like transcriptional regulator [Vibrio aerogenes CECT 7868]